MTRESAHRLAVRTALIVIGVWIALAWSMDYTSCERQVEPRHEQNVISVALKNLLLTAASIRSLSAQNETGALRRIDLHAEALYHREASRVGLVHVPSCLRPWPET